MFLSWQHTIVNDSGDVQPLALVEVKYQETGGDVSLFSDVDGDDPVSNPVQADGDGFVRFYVRNEGRTLYRVRAFRNGFERVWENVLVGIGERRTPAELAAGVMPADFAYRSGTPERFGAVGDDYTDNTTALLNWAKCATRGLKMECQPGAIYRFDPSATTNGILFSGVAGFSIYGNGAVFKSVDGAAVSAGYQMMMFTNCQDVYAEAFTIDANRANRTPAEASAFNLQVWTNCRRMKFNRVLAINGVTDGFYVGTGSEATQSTYPEDIVFDDCIAENCYRNNMSVIGSLRLTVRGGRYDGANGASPQGGIDVEPDVSTIFGNRKLKIEGVDCSNNNGYGLSIAGTGTAKNIGVEISRLSGSGNTGGLFTAGNVNGLIVNGIDCGPHSASTRGLVDLQAGDVTNVTLNDLKFTGVTINSTSRWLLYIHSEVDSRVFVNGLDVYNCPNVRVLSAQAPVTLRNVHLELVPDTAMQFIAKDCVLHGLHASASTGLIVYALGADGIFSDLIFEDCLVSSNYAMYVASAATGTRVTNVSLTQTNAIPSGAVGVFFDAVPRYINGITGKSANTDFTGANIVNFNAGTSGAFIANIDPDPYRVATTWNPDSIADGDEVSTTVTVTGAAFLDRAFAALNIDLDGLVLTADVSAADTVRVTLANNTGGAIDPPNSNLVVWVEKRA